MQFATHRRRSPLGRHGVAKAALVGTAMMALAACGSSSGGGSASTGGGNELAAIKSSHKISVADCLSFKPFGFYGSNGQPQGYDVDLAKLLAKKLHAKLNLVNVTSDNRIPYLQTGKVNVVFCNFTITPDRAQAIDFTIPYVVSGEGVLVNKNAGIASPSDLSGKKVAVTKGSTNSQLVLQVAPDAQVQAYNDDNSAIQAVKSGQADAFIEDLNYLTYQATTDPNLQLLHGTLGSKEYNGWGVKQGQAQLRKYLDAFIRKVTADGTSLKLYHKWFHASPLYPLSYTTNPTSGLNLVKQAENGS